jgi:hypothetical protein
MAQKSFRSEERKPSDYFKEVKAAQKQDDLVASDPVAALRADMVPASDAQPARESILQRQHIRVIVGVLLGVVIMIFILFIGVGPGRPILEQGLLGLAGKEITPTYTSTATPVSLTITPVQPIKTALPATQTPAQTRTATITQLPTLTPVVVVASPTKDSRTATPTNPGCRDVLSVTLADVGQTLCVKGTVKETIDHPSGFMVIFSNQPGAFYWISYDMIWSKAKVGTCYQVTGKIYQISNGPILVFNYHNIPEVCP